MENNVNIDLRLGDCLELMKDIPDGSIDAVITDPPYQVTSMKWDKIIPFEPMWEQLNRIIKTNGAVILTASQPFTTNLINSNPSMFRYSMVWVKDRPSNFANANKMPMRYHEDVCVFYKALPSYNKQYEQRKGSGANRVKYEITNGFNEGDQNEHKIGCKSQTVRYGDLKQVGTVLEIPFEARKKGQHGTRKPVALMEMLINMFSNEGETILDFTFGSGSTAIACLNTNRNFIGMELDEGYYNIAKQRVEDRRKELAEKDLFNI